MSKLGRRRRSREQRMNDRIARQAWVADRRMDNTVKAILGMADLDPETIDALARDGATIKVIEPAASPPDEK